MICAVIVTFYPDVKAISKLFSVLQEQVDHLIVVDNASPKGLRGELISLANEVDWIDLVVNSDNFGIARALNQGIDKARAIGAQRVLLLDQDSSPALDMVSTLADVLDAKIASGERVAAVGPCYEDARGQASSPFVRLGRLRLTRIECSPNEVVSVDHLITSGSLIPLRVLDELSGMNERLFIDYVDTEWCLRAVNRGYLLYGVGAARMSHNLGDGTTTFAGRTITLHSPLRYYYMLRNGIWLLRQPWVTFNWRLMDLRRLFLIYILFSIFVGSSKLENMKMMSLGLWHGISGKLGKYSPSHPKRR